MNKDFTKHNQALALKEIGFDEDCFGYYDTIAVTYLTYPSAINKNSDIENSLSISKQDKNVRCSAPLYQQAFRWFREKHELHSTITSISQESWQWHITKPGESLGKLYNEDFYTYEEAEQECLDKLIEICKNK